MSEYDNKSRLIRGAKVLGIIILSFIAIIANVTVFNMARELGVGFSFGVLCSVLNLIAEGFGIYFLQKAILKDKKIN